MYLIKSRGATYTTQTYAAAGGACAARLMYNSNADILADVDPMVAHANIIDYTHPLDPWGNLMLGVDNGGGVCFWGNAGLQAGDSALEYCGRVYGYTGPTLIAAQGEHLLPGGADANVALDFKRYRYITTPRRRCWRCSSLASCSPTAQRTAAAAQRQSSPPTTRKSSTG